MTDFYRRQFELFVSDRESPFIAATNDRQFKVVFNIRVDYGAQNSYADIVIYNLSRSSEAKVFKKGEYVGFRAGYETSIGYIFKGEIINIIREKRGADKITRLICRTGSTSTPLNQSFESSPSIQTLIRACADAMGFPVTINDDDFPGESPYLSGYLLSGDPKVKLDVLAKAHNFNWLTTLDRIVVTKSERSGAIITVSADTGMVGTAEITEIGADVVTKINPELRIDGRFEIKAEFAQVNFSNIFFRAVPDSIGEGVYVIQKLEFEGDSHGDVWDVKITGLAE